MKILSSLDAARDAVSAPGIRPATALLHDVPDARVVVFRIEPGQEVAPHTSSSTVLLSVIKGTGTVSGASHDSSVSPGDLVAYDAGELHGMKAGSEQLVITAIITPRPGTR